MDNKYQEYSKQQLGCLIAFHADRKRLLTRELQEIDNNLELMHQEVKAKAKINSQEVEGE